jgi:DHA2 family multidrug resistance protein-like MFS transporter
MFVDPGQRTFAIGIWATSFSAGAAIGPLLGGVLLEFFWWGSVFLLAVPVMAVLLVVGPRLLPEFRDPEAGRLDSLSAVLSVIAVLAVIYGVKRSVESGLDAPAASSIAAGVVVAALFLLRQWALTTPMIDFRLFRSRKFSAALAANTLSLAVAFGIFLFIAQYLQLVLELSALEAGLWTIPSAGGFIAGSMLAPVAVRRMSPAFAITGGLVVTAVGLGLLAQVGTGSSLGLLVVGSVVVGLGVALPVTLGTDLVVGSVPPERAGVASGISETGAELGGALGIAMLGSVGATVYRSRVADALPVGLPREDSEAARETLGGAVAAAEHLPDSLGATVLDAAQAAFAQGLHVAAITSAAVAIATALLAFLFLRGPTGEAERQAQLPCEPAEAHA